MDLWKKYFSNRLFISILNWQSATVMLQGFDILIFYIKDFDKHLSDTYSVIVFAGVTKPHSSDISATAFLCCKNDKWKTLSL